jgi:centromere/kinetochore protein ZW10
MDMHLSDIQTALANGVFRQVGAQELSRLILATFDESPKRRALLNTLANV